MISPSALWVENKNCELKMTAKIYGMPNCTTVRKARQWADENCHMAEFVPYPKMTDLSDHIPRWFERAGHDVVLNQKAQNFKKLDETKQAKMLADMDYAVQELAAEPRMLNRPLLEVGDTVIAGFDQDAWAKALS